MKKTVNSSIQRNKLYKKNYEADSRELVNEESQDDKSKEDFYEPLAELFTLIYMNK